MLAINTQKELEALIKMCRKHGVRNIEVDGVKMLIDAPDEHVAESSQSRNTADNVKSPDQYSDEDIMFWSSTPVGFEEGA